MRPESWSTKGKGILRNLGALLAGITIFLGAPLMGWGFTDLRGFLSDPVRLSYVVAVVVLQVGVVVLIPDVGRSRGRPKPDSEGSRGFLPLLQFIPLLLLILGLRREERLLHREFGAEWEEYAERSWRLVPFLY